MGKTNPREVTRSHRKRRIRRRVFGHSERPRLTVFRSCKHIYAQVIDDTQGITLVSVSDMVLSLKSDVLGKKKAERARQVGLEVASRCQEAGIKAVVFDRNGFMYHGRVKALAEGAREGGLDF